MEAEVLPDRIVDEPERSSTCGVSRGAAATTTAWRPPWGPLPAASTYSTPVRDAVLDQHPLDRASARSSGRPRAQEWWM